LKRLFICGVAGKEGKGGGDGVWIADITLITQSMILLKALLGDDVTNDVLSIAAANFDARNQEQYRYNAYIGIMLCLR
jgi:hypothetical protein